MEARNFIQSIWRTNKAFFRTRTSNTRHLTKNAHPATPSTRNRWTCKKDRASTSATKSRILHDRLGTGSLPGYGRLTEMVGIAGRINGERGKAPFVTRLGAALIISYSRQAESITQNAITVGDDCLAALLHHAKQFTR